MTHKQLHTKLTNDFKRLSEKSNKIFLEELQLDNTKYLLIEYYLNYLCNKLKKTIGRMKKVTTYSSNPRKTYSSFEQWEEDLLKMADIDNESMHSQMFKDK